MNNQISNKITFLLLATVLIVLGWVLVSKVSAPTKQLKVQYNTLKQEVNSNIDYDAELQNVVSRIQKIDALISINSDEVGEVQGKILDELTDYQKKYGISITSFPLSHQYAEPNFIIITNTIDVQSVSYSKLMLAIEDLETNFSNARLSASTIFSKKDLSTKKTKLYATLYFQNIKSR